MFIVLTQTQWTHVQRLSPEHKGVTPYIPLQAGYRSKKAKLNPHMAACAFIDYLFPQCYVIFMFQFFKFYLSALPSPPLVLWSEHSLSVSFLPPLPATVALGWPICSPVQGTMQSELQTQALNLMCAQGKETKDKISILHLY
jgi:hypothetical protein